MMTRFVANEGNLSALSEVMRKAERGEAATTAFIGGSITQGVAAAYGKAYADLTVEWWRANFPKAEISFINAGIGSTTSQFGAFRVRRDVLAFNPDVVFVEFSVNDEDTPFFKETYEGLIRALLSHKNPSGNAPAVIIFNMAWFDSGKNAQGIHNETAKHYDLPAVSVRDGLFPEIAEGRVKSADVSADNLHPNDYGHALCADLLKRFLSGVKDNPFSSGAGKGALPEPTTENRYQFGRVYDAGNITPVKTRGFVPDVRERGGAWDCFKMGWKAEQKGAEIVFKTEGSCLAVQYKKSPEPNMAKAAVSVFDENKNEIFKTIIDGNFEKGWGDYYEIENLIYQYGKYEVRVEIVDDGEFYLGAVLECFQ